MTIKMVGGPAARNLIVKTRWAWETIRRATLDLDVHRPAELWEEVSILTQAVKSHIQKSWEPIEDLARFTMKVTENIKSNRKSYDSFIEGSEGERLHMAFHVDEVDCKKMAVEVNIHYIKEGSDFKDVNWGSRPPALDIYCGLGPLRRLAELVSDNGLSILNCRYLRSKIYKYIKEEYKDMEGQRKKFPALLLEAKLKVQMKK